MRLNVVCLATVSIAAVACSNTTTTTSSYTVGGSVTGLNGTLGLADNGADHISVTSNGDFIFPTAVANGQPYVVKLLSQPASQTCTLTNNEGVISGANVTNIAVSCSDNPANPTYTIGGVVSGLTGDATVTLTNGSDQADAGEGTFTFPTAVDQGTTYDVQVAQSPSGFTCTIAGDTGSGTVVDTDITSVSVSCTANAPTQFSVGGTVSGATSSFVIRTNGADLGIDTQDTTFVFNGFEANTPYDIEVTSQPSGQNCNVTNGSGTVTNSNITNVQIICTDVGYHVAGYIGGTSGSFTISSGTSTFDGTADGCFTLPGFNDGDTYDVVVSSLPANQNCIVSNGSGTVGNTNVTGVSIQCYDEYAVGGTITGATGPLALQINNGSTLTVDADSYFFSGNPNLSLYYVTVLQPPDGQACTVSNDSGLIAGSDVWNANIVCTTGYTVSGTFVGDANGIILGVTDGDDFSYQQFYQTDNSGEFTVYIHAGNNWSVWPGASSRGNVCTLTSANGTSNTGTAIAADVTGVQITCAPQTYVVNGTVNFNTSGPITVSIGGTTQTVSTSGDSFTLTGLADQQVVTLDYSDVSCTNYVGTNDFTIDGQNVAGIVVTCD